MAGPCSCWVEVSVHDGHCCRHNASDDMTTCHMVEGGNLALRDGDGGPDYDEEWQE